MNLFCKRLCCAIFCCRCSSNPLKSIRDDTRLLPKNEKTRGVLEKNELHSFGVIPENLRGQVIDISNYTKSFVKKIVCGTSHCLVLFNDGQLAGFGENSEGQLGFSLKKDGNYINDLRVNKFEIVDPENGQNINDYEICDIGAGDNYSLVLIKSKMKPKLIKFGINSEDKYLNDFEKVMTVSIVALESDLFTNLTNIFVFGQRSLLLTLNNDLYVGGSDFECTSLNKYKHIEHFQKKIKNVHLGLGHCLVLDSKYICNLDEGNVYAIGDNTYGELGIIGVSTVEKLTRIPFEFSSKVKKISTGARHSLVLLDNGELYVFGDNSEGQCTGYNTRYSSPIKVEIESTEKIVDIYSGYNHNLIVMSNGEMLTWGDTSSGKLGYFEGNMTQGFPRLIQVLKGKYANQISLGFQMSVISTSSFENSLVNIASLN